MGEESETSEGSIFAVLVLLLIKLQCDIGLEKLAQRYPNFPINESSATIILGMVVGGIMYLLIHCGGLDLPKIDPHAFSEIFSVILLPPIIYAAGFTLKKRDFFVNFGPILLYCTVGTMLSSTIIGMSLWGLTAAGVLPDADQGGLSSSLPIEGLVIGAMLSATDPVATLAVFQELNVNKLLYSIVFGESVLNDAIGIVLFKTMVKFHTEALTGRMVGKIFADFLATFLGSAVIGCVVAVLSAAFLKRLIDDLQVHHQIFLMLITAYGSYIGAELLGQSGIMSLFICGILHSHYNWHTLSHDGKFAIMSTTRALAYSAETLVFLSLGFAFFDASNTSFDGVQWNLAFIACTLAACVVSRGLMLFPLSFIINIFRKDSGNKILIKYQLCMWFAGLRGAIAMILAYDLPEDFPARDLAINTTLVLVLFTNIVCGPLTRPLLACLDIETGTEGVNQNVRAFPAHRESICPEKEKNSFLHRNWKRLDNLYIKPYLGGRSGVTVVVNGINFEEAVLNSPMEPPRHSRHRKSITAFDIMELDLQQPQHSPNGGPRHRPSEAVDWAAPVQEQSDEEGEHVVPPMEIEMVEKTPPKAFKKKKKGDKQYAAFGFEDISGDFNEDDEVDVE